MRVKCDDCGKIYDDARCWTICPHHSLDWGPKGPPADSPYNQAHQTIVNAEEDHRPVPDLTEGSWPTPQPRRVSLCWYWRNFWVGVRYSGNRHAIYINLIPCLSLRITLRSRK